MSSQKFLIGHLFPHAFLPPTKTPTIGPPPWPTKVSILLFPSSFSAEERTNEGRVSRLSRSRALRKAGRILYLFLSGGLGIRTLNQRSHSPWSPARKRAPENPTMNEPMADCEQLTSTARSEPTDLSCLIRAR